MKIAIFIFASCVDFKEGNKSFVIWLRFESTIFANELIPE